MSHELRWLGWKEGFVVGLPLTTHNSLFFFFFI